MNIIEAIKSGRPVRRTKGHFSYQTAGFIGSGRTWIAPDAWVDPKWLLETVQLTKDDVLANDWEVEPDEVERLLERINHISRESGKHPEALDVAPGVFEKIRKEMAGMPYALLGLQQIEIFAATGRTRIVKGRAA